MKAIKITNGNDAGAGCLLDYSYLNNQCKWIAIDLSKQDLGANQKKKHWMNFTGIREMLL